MRSSLRSFAATTSASRLVLKPPTRTRKTVAPRLARAPQPQTLTGLLKQMDPDAAAMAQFAHGELRRRGLLPAELTLERWIADAAYERAAVILQEVVLGNGFETIFSPTPHVGGGRSYHFSG